MQRATCRFNQHATTRAQHATNNVTRGVTGQERRAVRAVGPVRWCGRCGGPALIALIKSQNRGYHCETACEPRAKPRAKLRACVRACVYLFLGHPLRTSAARLVAPRIEARLRRHRRPPLEALLYRPPVVLLLLHVVDPCAEAPVPTDRPSQSTRAIGCGRVRPGFVRPMRLAPASSGDCTARVVCCAVRKRVKREGVRREARGNADDVLWVARSGQAKSRRAGGRKRGY